MIDYNRLSRSLEYYEKIGYKRVESPWTVTKSISDITKPEGATDWTILEKNKVLVASGEQSFLYMYLKGFLPKGKFQTITPCFRDEPFDELHTKYFMKNELIITDNISEENLNKIINDAKTFLENELNNKIDIIQTNIGYDLEINDMEVGSYGIRSSGYLDWIYGTGLAEPRATYIKNKIRNGLS
jgi:seryl-tRNA synthetase